MRCPNSITDLSKNGINLLSQGLCQTKDFYLLWRIHIDNKTVARVESKREENPIGAGIENQPKGESRASIELVRAFCGILIPFVYKANGNKIVFKNLFKKIPTMKNRNLEG